MDSGHRVHGQTETDSWNVLIIVIIIVTIHVRCPMIFLQLSSFEGSLSTSIVRCLVGSRGGGKGGGRLKCTV